MTNVTLEKNMKQQQKRWGRCFETVLVNLSLVLCFCWSFFLVISLICVSDFLNQGSDSNEAWANLLISLEIQILVKKTLRNERCSHLFISNVKMLLSQSIAENDWWEEGWNAGKRGWRWLSQLMASFQSSHSHYTHGVSMNFCCEGDLTCLLSQNSFFSTPDLFEGSRCTRRSYTQFIAS